MESVIISGESEKDIQLLVTIAEKMGLSIEHIAKPESENPEKEHTLTDTDKFLQVNKMPTH